MTASAHRPSLGPLAKECHLGISAWGDDESGGFVMLTTLCGILHFLVADYVHWSFCGEHVTCPACRELLTAATVNC